ncbi:MAG: UDP-3-O-acyl-N-acetylglucosamine deacetylase [Thermodesulfobacteriota bacterium]|nr:UDP-3-O-acyl-N-acetylglucosamine deacetylase [Thermodesulfobacteriota bacterium]
MYIQKTIENEITSKSVGLHSGRKINMTIKPAEVDEGIVFYRSDLPGSEGIKAEPTNVSDTMLATTLGTNSVRISTVEHLLSALFGVGVDNAIIQTDSFEIPIMDGSSLPFVDFLKDAGIKSQDKSKRFVVIKKPVSVSDNEGRAALLPSSEFRITYGIDFRHPLIGKQSYDMLFSHETYEKNICAARTFGFLQDIEYLQARGLALGGSLNNAIVLDDEKVINKEGLRFPDEFVKHKILDAIGDLALLRMPIIGHFVAYKSGHRLNNLLLRKLLDNRDCWEMTHYLNGEMEVFDSIINTRPYDSVDDVVSLDGH